MKFNKIRAVLVLIGIHAFFAALVLLTGSVDTSGVKPNSADKMVVFLGIKSHAALTPVFESKPPEQKSAYFVPSLVDLTKLNVGASPSIKKARALVLLLDVEDNGNVENDLQLFFDTLPDSVPIICVAVPPVDNQVQTNRTNRQILEFNQKLKAFCRAQENCGNLDLTENFVDESGNLKPQFHTGDGKTFNERGNALWKSVINATIP